MPELPEVQTIVNDLEKTIPGKKIDACHIIRNSIIRGNPDDFQKRVQNRSVWNISRKGKYILITLSTGQILVVHLRMTGKFILQSQDYPIQQHDRVIFHLDNQKKLIFSDVRCFGTLELIKDWKSHTGLKQLGLDPWSRKMTPVFLKDRFKNRQIPIKTALLDQSVIAGIGNIYASEILFHAGIDPTTPAKTLSPEKLLQVIRSMRHILKQALKYNGTSISDYRRVDEKQGMFQNFLKVYGKADQNCINCSSRIIKIIQNQRSTFLCPHCQN